MSITEEKLLQWSTQESTDLCSQTYQFIKKHICELPFFKENQNDISLYLQGSYANNTNIRRDCDVDIVMQYNGVFGYDDSLLSTQEKESRKNHFESARFTFKEYKDIVYRQLFNELLSCLRVKSVLKKAKSIRISLENPTIEVDIVPCFQYRKYISFSILDPYSSKHYREGIRFENTETDDLIINYPKLHKLNGENKSSHTSNRYKQTIRYIKKIKSLIIEKGYIDEKHVSSYFIENLLYNVPNQYFYNSCLKTFDTLVFFLKHSKLNDFQCQHEQWKLFGDFSTQWNIDYAKEFIDILEDISTGRIIL